MAHHFNVSLSSIVLILFACAGVSSASWYYGPRTSTVDDAKSEVNCPSGYYVAECSCVDASTCDGAQVLPGRIKYCFAGHRYGISRPTCAKALCKPVGNLIVVTVSNHKLEGQYVSCPTGYTMQTCSKRDPWSQYRQTYLVKTSRSCAWRKGSGYDDRYIHISLVCVRPGPSSLPGGPSNIAKPLRYAGDGGYGRPV